MREKDVEFLLNKRMVDCEGDELDDARDAFDRIIEEIKKNFKYGIAKTTRHDVGVEKVKYQLVTTFNFESLLLGSDVDDGVDIGIKDGLISFLQRREPYETNYGTMDLKNEFNVVFIDRDAGDLLIEAILYTETFQEADKVLEEAWYRERSFCLDNEVYLAWIDDLKQMCQQENAEHMRLDDVIKSSAGLRYERDREREDIERAYRRASINVDVLQNKYGIWPNKMDNQDFSDFEALRKALEEKPSMVIKDIEKYGDDLFGFEFEYRNCLRGRFYFDSYSRDVYIRDEFTVINQYKEIVQEKISWKEIQRRTAKFVERHLE